MVIDEISFDRPKTKEMVDLFKRLEIGSSVLLVLGGPDVNVQKSARNIPGTKVLLERGVNVYDLLKHKKLLITKAALEQINERLGDK